MLQFRIVTMIQGRKHGDLLINIFFLFFIESYKSKVADYVFLCDEDQGLDPRDRFT